MLTFQSLDVYQVSISFLALSHKCLASWPRGFSDLGDQLRRAALSVPLNIAEAQGRTGAADRSRIYAIARGSAMECAAVLDVSRTLGLIGEDNHAEGISQLERVVAMLTRLCR